MSTKAPPLEQDTIIVGRPLLFSVFGAEGQLLLAEGSVVASDRARQMLLRKGVFHDSAGIDDFTGKGADAPAEGPALPPLAALQRDYGTATGGRRFALTVATAEGDEAHNTWVVGVHKQTIILTAPRRNDGSLVPVTLGQAWVCRAFQMTSAFRFRSSVLKVLFDPFPHVHIEAPRHVERRIVRGRPRAAVYLGVRLESPLVAPAVIVDLSISGGRLATEAGVRLERGHAVRVAMKLELIESQFELCLNASVVGEFGACDDRHPHVLFYGLRFEPLTELESLVLHSYVSGQLALELNSLWQMLSSASPA
jgi:hypothetical protein